MIRLPQLRGRFLAVAAALFLTSATTLSAADPVAVLNLPASGTDAAKIDYASLPLLEGAHAVVSAASLDASAAGREKFDLHHLRFELHNYLAWFDGKFWCIWSDGPPVEDEPTQEVRYATSAEEADGRAPRAVGRDRPTEPVMSTSSFHQGERNVQSDSNRLPVGNGSVVGGHSRHGGC